MKLELIQDKTPAEIEKVGSDMPEREDIKYLCGFPSPCNIFCLFGLSLQLPIILYS